MIAALTANSADGLHVVLAVVGVVVVPQALVRLWTWALGDSEPIRDDRLAALGRCIRRDER